MKSKILNSLSCISRNSRQSQQEITEQQVPQIRQTHNNIDVRFSKFNLITLEKAKQNQNDAGNNSCDPKGCNTQPQQIQSITNDALREVRLNLKKIHPEERTDLSSYSNDNDNPEPCRLTLLYNDMVKLVQELELLGQALES